MAFDKWLGKSHACQYIGPQTVTNDELQEKTAQQLQWPALLAHIAQGCRGPGATLRLQQLRPEKNYPAALARMNRTREAIELSAIAPLPVTRLEEQQPSFDALEQGVSLNGAALVDITQSLLLAHTLQAHLRKHSDKAPLLRDFLGSSHELGPLRDDLQRCLGPEGEILDAASTALKKARDNTLSIRQQLRSRLEKISEQLGEALQGNYVAEREGRYVLPVRSDAPFRVEGLVLGYSASGSTLYLEPKGTHELGNRMQRNEAIVRVEEARILRELNAALLAQLAEVQRAHQVCIEADILYALVLYAERYTAHAFEPLRTASMQLLQMRHPLLLEQHQSVVGNDLSLKAGQGLIISGPNAGGKTVALKCLGLASWMVRCGLPITAQTGSKVGWFTETCTDIGDNQSLIHSLSTFSAHVQSISLCLDKSSEQTLVLIDELCGGTDPDEGAALALAVLEALLEQGSAVCITTHYERLKIAAADNSALVNAAVGFDQQTMQPTFEVKYGAPGASSALLVARRYGIAPELLERAVSLMPKQLMAARALTIALQDERAELRKQLQSVQDKSAAIDTLRAELEAQTQRARTDERTRLAAETDSVLTEVRAARLRLQQAESQLKLGADSAQLQQTRTALNQVAQFVSIGGELRRAATQLSDPPELTLESLTWNSLALGTSVTLKSLGAVGQVVAKPKNGRVTLAIGSMKTTVRIEEVMLTSSGSRTQSAGSSSKKKPTGKKRVIQTKQRLPIHNSETGAEPMRTEENTCNLRGERVDDGLMLLDVFIDQMLQQGEPNGFVLHGHGTGALKSAVRQHLASHRGVQRAESATREDGGDAFTVFWTG